MRILHLATPEQGPGARSLLHALCEGYATAGHEVVVLPPGPTARPAGRRPHGSPAAAVRGTLLAELERVQPDRVEVADPRLGWVGAWAGTAGVGSLVLAPPPPRGGAPATAAPASPARAAERRALALAASFGAVVCPTSTAAERFTRLGVANARWVPRGTDLATFVPCRRDEELRAGLAQGARVLVAASDAVGQGERPDLLPAALRRLRACGVDARLVVLGARPGGTLRQAARGLPVTLLGPLPDRGELAAVLASVDVVVAPGAEDVRAVDVLAALACGTPVVAPAGSAAAEVVTDASGVVVPRTPAGLAVGVLEALELRAHGPGGPRARAEEFPWSRTVSSMLALHAPPAPASPAAAVAA
ncbi:alpha-1,6-mannosyltransferase [Motilibacter rhizosphaerae]|uniref:Alpha-1,6-mannosyltransferase n=1 Tax=Motilibacter rhizosphaerae TaxID=598652 RepID=A0A4Q7NRM5_9ACTN|nr:glycosyltransferase [Motilibacter rhizosphaerae]RZS89743.1 alpha-1,6-mannosyltransferase [Motilibacter rhizosphaerae]